MTPGMKTSEFALTVIASASALLLALLGHISGDEAMTAITVACGSYGVSRGLAKKGG